MLRVLIVLGAILIQTVHADLSWAASAIPVEKVASFSLPESVAKNYSDIPRKSLAVAWAGSQMIMAREYEAALALLHDYEKENPDDPIVSLGEMFVFHCHMIENMDFRFVKEFRIAESKNIHILESRRDVKKEATRWENLLAGASYGMRGMMFARQQKYLQAASIGYKAFSLMNKVEEQSRQQTPLYDTYFGKGMYHYWISWAKKKSLIFSPLGDKTELGLTELKMAADKAIIAAPLASFILAYLYSQEDRNHEAISLLFPLQEKFPQNLIVRTLMGRLFLAEGHMARGIETLESVLRVEPSYTVTGFYLGQALFYLKSSPERAIAHLEAFVFDKSTVRSKVNRSKGNFYLTVIYMQRGERMLAKQFLKEIDRRGLSQNEQTQLDAVKKELKG